MDYQDRVIVALDQPAGEKSVSVFGVFADGTELIDGYSDVRATVRDGRVTFSTPCTILLWVVPVTPPGLVRDPWSEGNRLRGFEPIAPAPGLRQQGLDLSLNAS